jgi:segregation and condensation protein B
MSLKAKLEAIIYAADEPVTLDQIAAVLKDDMQSESTVIEINAPREAAQDERDKAKQDKAQLRSLIDELISDYGSSDRGMEIREVAGGYRMSTKPEHHDLIRAFSKSLKPPMRLSLQALETLAVIAYKQPVTAPEISEIRGVDSSGVLANLLARKLITTAGRKQVIGRPILYKTTKDFLLRFGLKDVSELPSMEEFEKMAGDIQGDLPTGAVADATGVPDVSDAGDSNPSSHEESQAASEELPHASGDS